MSLKCPSFVVQLGRSVCNCSLGLEAIVLGVTVLPWMVAMPVLDRR
ncbi:hypothetical protein SynPROS71_01181 [Synechococcus sp. PROS-7-1]|nr:hypothetical protein SynBMKMC1_01292 [Synechococcus sp. BMK-MC-1]QNI84986.1 hypothetical protein SynPROS71_01181 [Synechococcus sp. PROS-7-1]